MWKDWGFAATLCDQAKHFLDMARQTATGSEQEGYIRASIVFAVMSFEAFFFREVITGYIQRHRTKLDATKVKKVEDGLSGKEGLSEKALRRGIRRFTGIQTAVKTWPQSLTGKTLTSTAFDDFMTLLDYRNALAHGDITRKFDRLLLGDTLAQEVETVANTELALQTISEMKMAAALHFGFPLT